MLNSDELVVSFPFAHSSRLLLSGYPEPISLPRRVRGKEITISNRCRWFRFASYRLRNARWPWEDPGFVGRVPLLTRDSSFNSSRASALPACEGEESAFACASREHLVQSEMCKLEGETRGMVLLLTLQDRNEVVSPSNDSAVRRR